MKSLLLFPFVFLCAAVIAEERPFMSVSENGRYLVGQDGKPFFYLADKVDLGVLKGQAKLTWYDVRTGERKPYSDKLLSGVQTIFPLEDDTDGDYVLIAETE